MSAHRTGGVRSASTDDRSVRLWRARCPRRNHDLVCRSVFFAALGWPLIILALPSCGARTESPPAPIDAALVTACVRFLACAEPGSYGPSGTLSACLWQYQDLRLLGADLVGCINSAGAACEDINACSVGSKADCAGVSAKSCNGPKLQFCRSGVNVINCPNIFRGTTCVIGADGEGQCADGTCDAKNPPPPCDGDVAVSCNQGVVTRSMCEQGQHCVAESFGGRCVADGPPCASARCDGDTFVECQDHQERRESCGDFPIPATCGDLCDASRESKLPCGFLGCIPSPRLACAPLDHPDTCAGSTIVFCDGAERSVDCRTLGFGGCSNESGFARCR